MCIRDSNSAVRLSIGRNFANSRGSGRRQDWKRQLEPSKVLLSNCSERIALWGRWHGTRVPFAKSASTFIFASEQFWGRAARAPRSRKRFEALVFWATVLAREPGANNSVIPSAARAAARAKSRNLLWFQPPTILSFLSLIHI